MSKHRSNSFKKQLISYASKGVLTLMMATSPVWATRCRLEDAHRLPEEKALITAKRLLLQDTESAVIPLETGFCNWIDPTTGHPTSVLHVRGDVPGDDLCFLNSLQAQHPGERINLETWGDLLTRGVRGELDYISAQQVKDILFAEAAGDVLAPLIIALNTAERTGDREFDALAERVRTDQAALERWMPNEESIQRTMEELRLDVKDTREEIRTNPVRLREAAITLLQGRYRRAQPDPEDMVRDYLRTDEGMVKIVALFSGGRVLARNPAQGGTAELACKLFRKNVAIFTPRADDPEQWERAELIQGDPTSPLFNHAILHRGTTRFGGHFSPLCPTEDVEARHNLALFTMNLMESGQSTYKIINSPLRAQALSDVGFYAEDARHPRHSSGEIRRTVGDFLAGARGAVRTRKILGITEEDLNTELGYVRTNHSTDPQTFDHTFHPTPISDGYTYGTPEEAVTQAVPPKLREMFLDFRSGFKTLEKLRGFKEKITNGTVTRKGNTREEVLEAIAFLEQEMARGEPGGGAGPGAAPLRQEIVGRHIAGMRNHFKEPTENFLDFKTQIEANTIQELRDERPELLAAIAILEQEWSAPPSLRQELVAHHVTGMRDHFKGLTENFLDFKTQVQSNNLPPEAQAERTELLAAIAILEQEWGGGTVPTHPETTDSDLVEIIRQDIDETIRRTKAPFIVLKEALERAPTDPNTKQAVHGFLPLLTSPKERQEINILLGRVPNEGLIQLAPKVVRNPDEDTQTVADIQTGIHAMLDNGDDPALVLRRTLDLDPTNPHVIQAVRSFLLLLEDSDPTRQEIEEIIARAERAGPAHFPLKDQSAPPVNAAEEQIQRRVATGESLGMILRDMLTTSLRDDPSVIQAVTAYLPQLTRPHEQESKTQIAQILDALRESAAHAEPEIPGAHRMHTLTQADLLQDWITLGLIKTNPIDVHPDQKLTVRCTFDHPATEPTAIAFLNSAQNGYYEGGAVIQPGQTSVTFTSVVPQGEERTWLVIRNLAFDGKSPLPLGVQMSNVFLDVEEERK